MLPRHCLAAMDNFLAAFVTDSHLIVSRITLCNIPVDLQRHLERLLNFVSSI
jgi:hypothetical protein